MRQGDGRHQSYVVKGRKQRETKNRGRHAEVLRQQGQNTHGTRKENLLLRRPDQARRGPALLPRNVVPEAVQAHHKGEPGNLLGQIPRQNRKLGKEGPVQIESQAAQENLGRTRSGLQGPSRKGRICQEGPRHRTLGGR